MNEITGEDIYAIVLFFVNKNNYRINKYEREDLVGYLNLNVWKDIGKYDSTRAKKSTFIYLLCEKHFMVYNRNNKLKFDRKHQRGDDNLFLKMQSKNNDIEDMLYELEIEEFKKDLTKRQSEVLDGLLEGNNPSRIALECGQSRQNVCSITQLIREKLYIKEKKDEKILRN